MYAHFKGLLAHSSPHEIIVDVGGVGYCIHISASVYALLPEIGTSVHMHTSFVVRENSQALYGFLSDTDKQVFELLLSVSGIGPKTALGILGHLSPRELRHAIDTNEIALISKVPGIGKKTAEKLILELRGKLAKFVEATPDEFTTHIKTNPETLLINDAMSALINLGYNQNAAQKAIKKTLAEAKESMNLALLITTCLKNI